MLAKWRHVQMSVKSMLRPEQRSVQMNSDHAPLLLRTCMCYLTICRPVQNHSWARAAVPALGSRHVAKLPSDITSALDRDSLTQMRSNTSSACYCSQKQYHYFH